MARKLLKLNKVSARTVQSSKVLFEICAILALFGALSCVSVRTYSPGNSDDSVDVSVDTVQIAPKGP